MRIATWNVNSIKQRLDAAVTWLAERKPDVVLAGDEVHRQYLRASRSRRSAIISQSADKGVNGVALLSKFPFDEVSNGLPTIRADDHARFIEAVVSTASGALRVASIYLPNGDPPNTEKYAYKMGWISGSLAIPASGYPSASRSLSPQVVASFRRPRTRATPKPGCGGAVSCGRVQFRALTETGITDTVRAASDNDLYSFWDYTASAWQKNNGIRIDHLLLSPEAADRLTGAWHRSPRAHLRKASDHVRQWLGLAIKAQHKR